MNILRLCVLSFCLSMPLGTSALLADVIPPGPPIPERTAPLQTHGGIPLLTIVGGIGLVSLSGSWIALRVIRKRNVKLPD
jgi:hypothetical protein